MQSKLPMHLSQRCGAQTRRGRLCRMHGGKSPGAPRGNKNALKHGLYTADSIADRRKIAALIRSMKGLAELVEEQE